MALPADTPHFSVISRIRCHAFITSSSTKSNQSLLLVGELSLCQSAGGWETFSSCNACCVLPSSSQKTAVTLWVFWMCLMQMGGNITGIKTAVKREACSLQLCVFYIYYIYVYSLNLCTVMHQRYSQLCFSWMLFHWGWYKSQKIATEMDEPPNSVRIVLLWFTLKGGIVSSIFFWGGKGRSCSCDYYMTLAVGTQHFWFNIWYWPDGRDVRSSTSAALGADSSTAQAALPVGMS